MADATRPAETRCRARDLGISLGRYKTGKWNAITDVGGVMSHAAIVCREYGMPAVVGTGHATKIIKTGMMLRVDGSTGAVSIAR